MAKTSGGRQNILIVAGGLALFLLAWKFHVPILLGPPARLLSALAVLVGILAGPKQGSLIAALYVLAVTIGLPQALWGGRSGEPFMDQPLSGLNLGLIAAAAVAGAIAPGSQSGYGRLALAALAGHAAYLGCGFLWALRFYHPTGAAAEAVYPFLPASAVEAAGAFLIAAVASRFVK